MLPIDSNILVAYSIHLSCLDVTALPSYLIIPAYLSLSLIVVLGGFSLINNSLAMINAYAYWSVLALEVNIRTNTSFTYLLPSWY